MKSIAVRLRERSYDVLIGSSLLSETGSRLKRCNYFEKNVLIVTQKPIAERYLPGLSKSLQSAGFNFSSFIIEIKKSSEEAKSGQFFFKLLGKIAAFAGKGRSLSLLALGGGVIGDLTGFAASTYRRGISYAQIPTTLTAQVDSAIGGKTGIDLPEGKNLLGTIYQPALVLEDVDLLESLPERHWSDGFAEVIKYAVIKDPRLFRLLEEKGMGGVQRDRKLLTEIVSCCVKIKAQIVEKDELDKKGLRAILNFGHTAGHAIESASEYSGQYTHGEAVGIGMLVACDIAEQLKILRERDLTARIEKLLLKFNLPIFFKNLSLGSVMTAMGYDKKSEKGKNRFILPVKLGETKIVSGVPLSYIEKALTRKKR